MALSTAQTKRRDGYPQPLTSEKGSLCARIFVVSTFIILVVRSHAVVVIIIPSLVKSFSTLRLFLFVCSFCHFVLHTIRLIEMTFPVALALSYSSIPLVWQDLSFPVILTRPFVLCCGSSTYICSTMNSFFYVCFLSSPLASVLRTPFSFIASPFYHTAFFF